jgi:hypothetical protein
MSTDLENLTASFGLVRREFRDVHAVVSRLDTQVRRLVEPRARPRPGGLVADLKETAPAGADWAVIPMRQAGQPAHM